MPRHSFSGLISAILIYFRTLVLAFVSQVVLQSLVPELPHVMSGHAKAPSGNPVHHDCKRDFLLSKFDLLTEDKLERVGFDDVLTICEFE